MPSELFFNMYSLVSHFGIFTLKFLLIKNFNFGKIYTYHICYLNHFIFILTILKCTAQ